ncbi:hypothetical protein BT96DRAFT_586949 [Gymnopus androsaceus JB14]|uniref:Uncharacterized protein n=1 Tax=Gymnopus androsaceus JB14 TaxID=1447944 RepID=A0A6A4IGY8_9AGAR|nr:hypothetical protein BT96DRAFT_586949 [Gymnopus androsaceus JB14]
MKNDNSPSRNSRISAFPHNSNFSQDTSENSWLNRTLLYLFFTFPIFGPSSPRIRTDCNAFLSESSIEKDTVLQAVIFTYPRSDFAVDFTDIPLFVEDSITLTATVSTPTSGTLVITNNSQNVTVSMDASSNSNSLLLKTLATTRNYPGNSHLVLLNGIQVTPDDGDIDYSALSRFHGVMTISWRHCRY